MILSRRVAFNASVPKSATSSGDEPVIDVQVQYSASGDPAYVDTITFNITSTLTDGQQIHYDSDVLQDLDFTDGSSTGFITLAPDGSGTIVRTINTFGDVNITTFDIRLRAGDATAQIFFTESVNLSSTQFLEMEYVWVDQYGVEQTYSGHSTNGDQVMEITMENAPNNDVNFLTGNIRVVSSDPAILTEMSGYPNVMVGWSLLVGDGGYAGAGPTGVLGDTTGWGGGYGGSTGGQVISREPQANVSVHYPTTERYKEARNAKEFWEYINVESNISLSVVPPTYSQMAGPTYQVDFIQNLGGQISRVARHGSNAQYYRLRTNLSTVYWDPVTQQNIPGYRSPIQFIGSPYYGTFHGSGALGIPDLTGTNTGSTDWVTVGYDVISGHQNFYCEAGLRSGMEDDPSVTEYQGGESYMSDLNIPDGPFEDQSSYFPFIVVSSGGGGAGAGDRYSIFNNPNSPYYDPDGIGNGGDATVTKAGSGGAGRRSGITGANVEYAGGAGGGFVRNSSHQYSLTSDKNGDCSPGRSGGGYDSVTGTNNPAKRGGGRMPLEDGTIPNCCYILRIPNTSRKIVT